MDTFKSSDGKWFYMSILEPDRYNDALFKELEPERAHWQSRLLHRRGQQGLHTASWSPS